MANSDDTKNEERFGRDDPERQAPNRGPKGLISETVQQAISEMVQLSKSVIEEQILAGRSAAAQMRDDVSKSGALNEDLKSMADNLVATTKDVANAWINLLNVVVRSMGAQPSSDGYPTSRGATGGSWTMTSEGQSGVARTTSRLTPSDPTRKVEPCGIVVKGRKVTEVALDLRPPSMRFVPMVHQLHASDARNSIGAAQFSLDAQGKLVLNVDVPHDHPAGTYTGVIVDSTTNEPGGTVSVTVGG